MTDRASVLEKILAKDELERLLINKDHLSTFIITAKALLQRCSKADKPTMRHDLSDTNVLHCCIAQVKLHAPIVYLNFKG